MISPKSKEDKLTNFIHKANSIHSNKFEYSLVTFDTRHDVVTIICPLHGSFSQPVKTHLNPKESGCMICRRELRERNKRDKFILAANDLYNKFYDYSEVVYTTTSTKVCIICPTHGPFMQMPKEHMRYGCIKCGWDRTAASNTKDTTWFISRAQQVHGPIYDYSKSEYTLSTTPICIICPIHGEFNQQPNHHLNTKCGCPKCIMSTGERTITGVLHSLSLDYEYEYKIYRPGVSRPLRYDFFIPTLNKIIEYDGEQHFFPVKFHGMSDEKALKAHNDTVRRDKIKNQYAIDHNIPILRIPYYQYNEIEQLVGNFISSVR